MAQLAITLAEKGRRKLSDTIFDGRDLKLVFPTDRIRVSFMYK
jgi:hypothetical protein